MQEWHEAMETGQRAAGRAAVQLVAMVSSAEAPCAAVVTMLGRHTIGTDARSVVPLGDAPDVEPRHVTLDFAADELVVWPCDGIVTVGDVPVGRRQRRSLGFGGRVRLGSRLVDVRLGTWRGDRFVERRARAAHPVVRVVQGRDLGAWVELAAERPYAIGRHARSDLPIGDALVSRLHVHIRREGARVLVQDQRTRNGARLGTEPLGADAWQVWDPELALVLGDTVLALESFRAR